MAEARGFRAENLMMLIGGAVGYLLMTYLGPYAAIGTVTVATLWLAYEIRQERKAMQRQFDATSEEFRDALKRYIQEAQYKQKTNPGARHLNN